MMNPFIELSAVGQGTLRVRPEAVVAVLPHDDTFGESSSYVYLQGRNEPFRVSERPEQVMQLLTPTGTTPAGSG